MCCFMTHGCTCIHGVVGALQIIVMMMMIMKLSNGITISDGVTLGLCVELFLENRLETSSIHTATACSLNISLTIFTALM